MAKAPKTTTAPTGQIAPFGLRMLPELREKIEAAARESGRSMNAEIVSRLESTFDVRAAKDKIASHPGESESIAARIHDLTRIALQNKLYELLQRRSVLSHDRRTYELLAPALREDTDNPRSRVELEILEKDRESTELELKKIERMLMRLELEIEKSGFFIDEGGPDEDQIVLRDSLIYKQPSKDEGSAVEQGSVLKRYLRAGGTTKKAKE